jgi:anti-sigma regulatory factor (Ser/Thr protein kinase)
MSILNYECKATAHNIEVIDDMIELLLKLHSIDWYRSFCFATHELLINSVEAMSKDPENNNKLYIRITIGISAVTLSVSDTGGGLSKEILDSLTGFDLADAENHGRGLFMIQSLVDDFKFSKEENGRYTYKITKNRLISMESGDF